MTCSPKTLRARTPRRDAIARLFCLASLALVTAPATLWAQEDAEVAGEVVINTGVKFVRFSVNGKQEWDNHEYASGDKTLIVLGLDRSQDNLITLQAREEGLEPIDLTIKPKEFKRTMVKRGKARVAVYRSVRTVKFAKPKPAPTEPTTGAPPGDAKAEGGGAVGEEAKGDAGKAKGSETGDKDKDAKDDKGAKRAKGK